MRALIVLLEEGVTEFGAEQILVEIESDYPGDVTRVEHFTEKLAIKLIEKGKQ